MSESNGLMSKAMDKFQEKLAEKLINKIINDKKIIITIDFQDKKGSND